MYRDVLGRHAEPQGREFWVSHLASGDSRAKVVQDILAAVTEEYHVDLVRAEFARYLHRTPEAAAMQFFTGLLDVGGDARLLDDIILSSPEYFAAHGSANDQFLDALFGDALHRSVDPDARSFFDDLFAKGASRAQVADLVFSGHEYHSDLVADWFMHYLDRAADATGSAPFVAQLDAGSPGEQVIAALLASDEYVAKIS